MSIVVQKVYDILKAKLGDKEAEAVIEYLESKTEEKYQQKKEVFLTKDDKIDIISKIEATKTDMIKWFFAFFVTVIVMVAGLYLK